MTARRDPLIASGAAWQARAFQLVFPTLRRLLFASSRLQFGTTAIAKPVTITIPTRHGDMPALVYAPPADQIAAPRAIGRRPPVHLIVHGGGFVLRVPEQEDNVARFLASEVGCYVVIPDYDTAPNVRFPVAKQQCYDAYRWIRHGATAQGWDGERVSVGGSSAGGKLAVNVALMAIDDGFPPPLAVSAEYPVLDLTLGERERRSPKAHPMIGPFIVRLVLATYFAGADPVDPLASPALHPRIAELPPTLLLTAEFDTLRAEAERFAADLRSRGVTVTHREFAGVDHGFTHVKPVETAREAIELIGDHLRRAYQRTTTQNIDGAMPFNSTPGGTT